MRRFLEWMDDGLNKVSCEGMLKAITIFVFLPVLLPGAIIGHLFDYAFGDFFKGRGK